jgi:hypothetical protein
MHLQVRLDAHSFRWFTAGQKNVHLKANLPDRRWQTQTSHPHLILFSASLRLCVIILL